MSVDKLMYQPDRNVYAFAFRLSDGQVSNTAGTVFESLVDANWDNYDIACTEDGTSSGVYTLTLPAGVSALNCHIEYFERLGASPAISDPQVGTGSYNSSTPQTGDAYAIVNSGVHGNAAIKGYVDDIGAAGAGLTNIPWNAAWDDEVRSDLADALDAAVPGSPTANSINERLKTLDDAYTAARAIYLDNLNVGGPVASSAEATAIQNNTRVVRVVPTVFERPDSGTTVFRIELLLYDDAGNMEVPDSAPTLGVVNEAGTSRDANLDSTTMALVSTGRYRVTYTIGTSHAIEQLLFAFSVVEGGATRIYANAGLVVDTTAVDFTSADRTKLNTLHDTRIPGVIEPQTGDAFARLGAPAGVSVSADIAAVKSDSGSLVTSLTALAGKFTGITLLRNWLRLMLRSDAGDATAKAELGGTYDETSHSQEASFVSLKSDTINMPAIAIAVNDLLDGNAAIFVLATDTKADTAAIKLVSDKLDLGLEADGGVFRFTANMLEQGPAGGGGGGGDATLANQTTMLANLVVVVDLLQADAFTKRVGNWQTELRRKGTSDVILRKNLYEVDLTTPITSTSQILGGTIDAAP